MAINFQPIYILASGGERATEQLDTTTNNIANSNTPGFKKLLVREMSQKIPENKGKVGDLLVFPRFMDSSVLNFQGPLIKTENNLDLAIVRDGFFTVESAIGRYYTRNGHFSINQEGYLVDVNGAYVLDENFRRIQIQDSKFQITPKGEIYQNGQITGKIRVVNLQNLQAVGNSYYQGQEQQITNFEIKQGYLEGANLNIVKEMVEMINNHRRFDIYMNLAKYLDMLEGKVNEIGKA
ncbi:MAG TPA: flagellar hook basal-body protein [Sulfurihydrogenibium sp.]|uniref:flagellar hook-basal body protein n=1 Tax=Sulfurihydrogenibium sp. (strain YO3AOP1) TaxID=436114 RepID=UPI0001726397|nr:flagellar hook basal-body protein [Sulfurihydrogenibium sp. YO3AOP1]ACD67255.1 flagellar basal body rod protein [Sulfurihydrogenibium sp. YO3AOP1]HBT98588.1 flagellar hook basal-body protein [Sulfurihydrogenibium sp.]